MISFQAVGLLAGHIRLRSLRSRSFSFLLSRRDIFSTLSVSTFANPSGSVSSPCRGEDEGEGPHTAPCAIHDSALLFPARIQNTHPNGRLAPAKRPPPAPRPNRSRAHPLAPSPIPPAAQRQIPPPVPHRPLLRRLLLDRTTSDRRTRWRPTRRAIARRSTPYLVSQFQRLPRPPILERPGPSKRRRSSQRDRSIPSRKTRILSAHLCLLSLPGRG